MRDGYLPYLACNAFEGESIGNCARISRFAAIAASFRTLSDVERYLATNAKTLRFEDMCRQLLLPKQIASAIIQEAKVAAQPPVKLSQLILQEDILNLIFAYSSAYFQRFKKYLENEIGVQAGDTLLLVDLGYTGTTPN